MVSTMNNLCPFLPCQRFLNLPNVQEYGFFVIVAPDGNTVPWHSGFLSAPNFSAERSQRLVDIAYSVHQNEKQCVGNHQSVLLVRGCA